MSLPDYTIGFDENEYENLLLEVDSFKNRLVEIIDENKPNITSLLNDAWIGEDKDQFEIAINKVFEELNSNFEEIFTNMKTDFSNMKEEWLKKVNVL